MLTQAHQADQAARLVGLGAVGTLLQTWLGSQVAHGPAAVRAVAAQWTTTGRLSVWAQGQCALREPLLAAWVAQTLHAGAARVAAAPAVVLAPPPGLDTERPPRRRRAA